MNMDKLNEVVHGGFYTYVPHLTYPLVRAEYFRDLGCEVRYSHKRFEDKEGFVNLSLMSYGVAWWHIRMSNEVAERILVLGLPL